MFLVPCSFVHRDGRTDGRAEGGGTAAGCRDVFKCARVLSNGNLSKGEERDDGGEVWDGMLEK